MRNKVILMMIMGVALMALPAKAQTFGAQKVDQPNAVFHSTSTMMGSGSQYSANPTLNADGTAAYEGATYSSAKAPGGPRRNNNSNPGVDDNNDDGNTPIGDALIPLTLFAGAYLVIRAARRKVRSMTSERCK